MTNISTEFRQQQNPGANRAKQNQNLNRILIKHILGVGIAPSCKEALVMITCQDELNEFNK